MYEDEPNLTPGLDHCENVVIVPHIASASLWTRSGMVRPSPPFFAVCLHAIDMPKLSIFYERESMRMECFDVKDMVPIDIVLIGLSEHVCTLSFAMG